MNEQLRLNVSKGFNDLLEKLKVTILLSTYQAGKVMAISAKNGRLVQTATNFKKPMGIALDHTGKMAVACLNEVRVYKSAPRLAGNFPEAPNTYDTLFMPRGTYFSGTTDIHDLVFGNDKLWAVNTLFSCICSIDHNHSFTPYWQPSFIDDLLPEDRCHLNGMDLMDGEPAIVSALGQGNKKESWREDLISGGVIIDIPSNKILLDGLAMPHAPRLYGEKLYFLQSALGLLSIYEPKTRKKSDIPLPGFPRGMAIHDNLLFIGMSKIRKSSKSFSQLPVKEAATHAGLVILDAETGTTIAQMRYENHIDEIYDVQVLPGATRPFIINSEDDVHNSAIAAPDLFFWRRKRNG